MNTTELREKSVEELQGQLQELYKDQFNYRMQKGSGQLGQVHLVSEVRKDIARIKTLITEKNSAGAKNTETQKQDGELKKQDVELQNSESE